jgi:two-component system, OmpR family, sensor histidine kinase QseC
MTNPWRALWQPSLARRLVLAALLAFGLVAVVLMTSAFLSYRHQVNSHAALLSACQHLSESLVHAGDPAQARVVVLAAETYFNAARKDFSREHHRQLDPLLFELAARNGQTLYASAGLQGTPLQSQPGQASEQTLQGRPYWGCAAPFAGGTVRLAELKLADTTVLSWIGADLLPDLLLSFPFVLVPVWVAMHQGLRPLRRLARQLDQRSPDDFSPIDLGLQHAELRPLIHAFDTVLARLRKAVQRERAFVQDAAHELRTPMAVISAQAHVLTRAGSPAERLQAEAALDHAIARASHLSQQLLALAALDEHRAQAVQTVDLVVLTEQALAPAAATAQACQIELSLDAPEHLQATLDVGAFQSVLQNLLDNALRYVPPGSTIEVTLQPQAISQPGGWRLRVADNGPGIPPEEHARIFDRFVRGRQPTAPGTGLGLAIVRQAARRLGGDVQLQAGLQGRGVAFEVSVPALWES